jgi:autotransporter-associated beta strand protein
VVLYLYFLKDIMQKVLRFGGLLATTSLLLSPAAQAASFNITTASTTKQTLAAGETGNVSAAGSLTVTGNNVAVTVTGNSTLTNLGSIQQTSVLTGGNAGNSRVIRDNTGGLTLSVTNGSASNSTALMQTADADVIQMKVAGSNVTFNNYGILNSQNSSAGGNQAVDWASLTTGNNTLNNYATGKITATEADAVRPGVSGVVYNAGQIKSTTATGSSSDGVDAQTNSNVQITNDTTGTIEGGRHGITGGNVTLPGSYAMSVTNNVGGIVKGDNGSGVNVDGLNSSELVTITNHGTISGNGITGDGDGIDVDGLVNINNTGIIRSINAFSSTTPAHSEGITVGGGTIVNSGTIEGLVAAGNTNAVGFGISLLGNDSLTLPGTREAIYGNATVTNQAGGLIRGGSESGIFVDGPASGHTVTINNNAGATIQGGGATTAAILTGADNDTITNAGVINGSSSGKAIDLGAGDNTLTVQGGAASIQGDVSGGGGGNNTLNLNIGTGNSFAYSGSLSNFTHVQVNSGTTTLSGASTYTGSTTVNAGALLATNTTGSATGNSAVEVKSGASIGGTGIITGSLTVDQGGTLSPGIGDIGSLRLGSTTLSANSTFALDLDPTNAQGLGTNDLLRVAGAISLDHSNLLLTLLSAPTRGQFFNILFNDGSDTVSGFFNQGNYVSASYGGHNYSFYVDYSANVDGGTLGNDIRLTTIPEPSTGFLFGLGGLALLLKRRFAKAAYAA